MRETVLVEKEIFTSSIKIQPLRYGQIPVEGVAIFLPQEKLSIKYMTVVERYFSTGIPYWLLDLYFKQYSFVYFDVDYNNLTGYNFFNTLSSS